MHYIINFIKFYYYILVLYFGNVDNFNPLTVFKTMTYLYYTQIPTTSDIAASVKLNYNV